MRKPYAKMPTNTSGTEFVTVTNVTVDLPSAYVPNGAKIYAVLYHRQNRVVMPLGYISCYSPDYGYIFEGISRRNNYVPSKSLPFNHPRFWANDNPVAAQLNGYANAQKFSGVKSALRFVAILIEHGQYFIDNPTQDGIAEWIDNAAIIADYARLEAYLTPKLDRFIRAHDGLPKGFTFDGKAGTLRSKHYYAKWTPTMIQPQLNEVRRKFDFLRGLHHEATGETIAIRYDGGNEWAIDLHEFSGNDFLIADLDPELPYAITWESSEGNFYYDLFATELDAKKAADNLAAEFPFVGDDSDYEGGDNVY